MPGVRGRVRAAETEAVCDAGAYRNRLVASLFSWAAVTVADLMAAIRRLFFAFSLFSSRPCWVEVTQAFWAFGEAPKLEMARAARP
jgi:hypothetical protein